MLLPVAMVAWPQLPAPYDDTLLLFTVHFGVWKPQTLLWVDVGMSGAVTMLYLGHCCHCV